MYELNQPLFQIQSLLLAYLCYCSLLQVQVLIQVKKHKVLELYQIHIVFLNCYLLVQKQILKLLQLRPTQQLQLYKLYSFSSYILLLFTIIHNDHSYKMLLDILFDFEQYICKFQPHILTK